jgi:hypothetical protein
MYIEKSIASLPFLQSDLLAVVKGEKITVIVNIRQPLQHDHRKQVKPLKQGIGIHRLIVDAFSDPSPVNGHVPPLRRFLTPQ